jgi:thiol-disulfide isomerase/thioredoxin
MDSTRRTWLVAGMALAGAAGGFALRKFWAPPLGVDRSDDADPDAAAALRELSLADLQGRQQALAQWRGKVLVVNFWATWCQPCREEIPGLLRIEREQAGKNLQMVGIAVDNADNVKQFAQQFKIDYPLLVGGLDVLEISRRLGNRAGGLPFTVVMDSGGNLVKTHLGQISEKDLGQVLAPLLVAG